MKWTPATVGCDTARSVPLSSPANVNVPVDVLLTWHVDAGIPNDWESTAATWGAPEALPDDLHHVRAVYEGTTVGVHLATVRPTGRVMSVWCGVDEAWRRQGLAQRLVARHRQWAEPRPFRAHTPAMCRAMLVARLKAGFEVVGSFTDADGDVVMILEA